MFIEMLSELVLAVMLAAIGTNLVLYGFKAIRKFWL
jgi:hypothetical protein